MSMYLSPGVFPNEVDLSVLPAGEGPIRPAFIGTANKGPINTPTYITTAEQAIETFGEPFSDSYLMYALLAYLEKGNQCYVLRVGVECDDGQDTALDDICIDTSGNKGKGWGRIALFSGIDHGKLALTSPTTAVPFEFHDSAVSDIDFEDTDVSSSDGACVATLTFTGTGLSDTYTGPIDDAFIVQLLTDPTSGTMEGATYQIIESSSGFALELSASGATTATITESVIAGTSDDIAIGYGDDDTGLDCAIVVTGTSPLEAGDYFTFNARPDNRTFVVAVDGDIAPSSYSFIDGTSYTTAAAFVAAFNLLIGASEDYIAAVDGSTLHIKTDIAGERIQITGSEAFCLEVGLTKWAYDIPRSYLINNDSGPFNINSTKDRVAIEVIGTTNTATLAFTIPTNSSATCTQIAASIDAGGISGGETYFNSYALQITDNTYRVVVETATDHKLDILTMLANYSHLETLKFAEELEFTYPYTRNYRTFTDSRVILPTPGSITSSMPLSCETAPASSQCALDTAYFANVVGFLVAKYPGTWVDDLTCTLENFNSEAGRYTIKIFKSGLEIADANVSDVSFDSNDARYIANVVNEGSSIGGVNGNPYFSWEMRPSYLITTGIMRYPAPFSNETFAGGANGIPEDAIYSSEIDRVVIGNPAANTGIHAFSNPEIYDIALLSIPGNSSGSVIGQGIQLCEGRGDCLFIVDPPYGLKPQQVVDWHNGMLLSDLSAAINSSYGALYWSWLNVFDQFANEELYIPPSGYVCGVYASTANSDEIWDAPAGLERGHLTTALNVEYNPTIGEQELLYGSGNAVNAIVNFSTDGITIWGQRTLQRTQSALDRVNVRMLLIHIKKNLVPALRNYVFNLNNDSTRALVEGLCDDFMDDIRAREGVTAYNCVCDKTNNTPMRIDRNELWVSIYLKPTRVVEFIVLNLVVLRTEQAFSSEEVLAAGGVIGI